MTTNNENELLQRIDSACEDFEAKWRSEGPPKLSDYLGSFVGAERKLLIKYLLEIDQDYRRVHGLPVEHAFYVATYPELADEISWCFAQNADSTVRQETDALVGGQLSPNDKGTTPTRRETGPIRIQSDDALPGASDELLLGEYEIIREVGRGGMGVVYEAVQKSLQRRVALKLLPAEWKSNEQAVSRFRLEARAAAKLTHENIVRVYEVGLQDDVLYYAMDFVDGVNLSWVIKNSDELFGGSGKGGLAKRGSLDTKKKTIIEQSLLKASHSDSTKTSLESPESPVAAEVDSQSKSHKVSSSESTRANSGSIDSSYRNYIRRVGQLTIDVAYALHYAHENGVIHRDIKPANLLLDESGRVWVTDFGLAKTDESDLTRTGDILGTLRYMSPERFQGKCDETADVFALGLTLYELLARRPAFDAVDRASLIETIIHNEPDDLKKVEPRVPFNLVTIVNKAIAKEPSRRYATAAAFAEDIERFLNGEPILARKVGHAEKLLLWSRKNPLVSSLAAVVVLILLSVAIVSSIAAANFRAIASKEKRSSEQAIQEKENAEQEERIAAEINSFFNDDILGLADAQRSARDVTVRDALLAAAERIEGRFDDMPVVEGEIRRTIGRGLASLGRFEEGIAQLTRSNELLEKALGPENPKTIATVGELGRAYRDWEKPEQSRPYMEQHLAAMKTMHGEDSPQTIQAMHMYGMILDELDEFDEAVEILTHTLEWRRENLGEKHPQTIRSLVVISQAYLYSGRLEQATPYVTIAAEYALEVFGEEDVVTLVAHDDLSQYLMDTQRYSEAEQVMLRGLDLTRSYFGENHPGVIAGMGKLADLYKLTDRLEESAQLRHKLIELASTVFGPNSADAFTARFELSSVMRALEQYEESNEVLLAIRDELPGALGPTHFYNVTVEFELGQLDFAQADYPAALEHFESAHAMCIEIVGEEHGVTENARTLIANASWMLEDFETARTNWKRTLEISNERGESIRRNLPLRRQVAMADLKLGDYELAKELILDSYPLFEQINDESPALLVTKHRMLLDLVQCHLKLSELEEAETIARQVVSFDGWEEDKKYRHYRAQVLLGTALLRQDRFDEAEIELVDGYQGLVDHSGKPTDQKLGIEGMIELLQSTDREDELSVWQTRLDELESGE